MEISKKRIIVVGATGHIGSELFRGLQKSRKNQIFGTYFRTSLPGVDLYLDLTDYATYSNLGRLRENDIVLLLSAVAQPQKVFTGMNEAMRINTIGTRNFLDYLSKTQAKLVYFSSVEVFDGSRAPSSEDDICNPLNEYGRQKYRAEAYIRSNFSRQRYKIVRLPWNISLNTGVHCVVENTYNAIMTNQACFAEDYLSSAISVMDTLNVVKLVIDKFDLIGENILHVASDQFFSRFELANFIRESSPRAQLCTFKKVRYSDLVLLEPRSQDARLNNSLVKQALGYTFHDIWPLIARKVAKLDLQSGSGSERTRH